MWISKKGSFGKFLARLRRAVGMQLYQKLRIWLLSDRGFAAEAYAMKINIGSIVTPVFISVLFVVSTFAAQPIDYKVIINPSDLSGFNVEMRVRAARADTRIAMAVHPEYDDRYWRYIENFSATDGRGSTLQFKKEEDTVWKIENQRGNLLIRYRLRLPPHPPGTSRDAWKPFLTEHGGMVGDLHSLMYVAGEESRRGKVSLDMPSGWKAASGLEPTRDPRTFTGSTALILDSPIMIGSLTEHDFQAGGIPHKIVFWSSPDGPAFDANAIVTNVRKLSEETIRAFGPPPYPRYVFMFQNGGQSALEHVTSVNLGLSASMEDLLEETGHEYVHVWNLMDVRPRERIGVRYRFAEPTSVLWWSEGATIMFADILIRRARLPGESRTRLQRLESSIARYLTSPGYYTLSAEQVSRGDSHPLLLGNNFASTHLQGEILSVMLDLKIRDVTDGRRKADDVMRLLARRFDSSRGIVNSDIERAITDVCSCDIRPFFREHIYGAKKIDFDHYLGLMGVRAEIGSTPAVNRDGTPAADLRIGPMSTEGGVRLRIINSESAWARSGLNTGDMLVSIDGIEMPTWGAFRQWLQRANIGDIARVVVLRDGIRRDFEVAIGGYSIPTVRLVEVPTATAKQVELRNAWSGANWES
jgi:predicted metalloprotease with PDZ domain